MVTDTKAPGVADAYQKANGHLRFKSMGKAEAAMRKAAMDFRRSHKVEVGGWLYKDGKQWAFTFRSDGMYGAVWPGETPKGATDARMWHMQTSVRNRLGGEASNFPSKGDYLLAGARDSHDILITPDGDLKYYGADLTSAGDAMVRNIGMDVLLSREELPADKMAALLREVRSKWAVPTWMRPWE